MERGALSVMTFGLLVTLKSRAGQHDGVALVHNIISLYDYVLMYVHTHFKGCLAMKMHCVQLLVLDSVKQKVMSLF